MEIGSWFGLLLIEAGEGGLGKGDEFGFLFGGATGVDGADVGFDFFGGGGVVG